MDNNININYEGLSDKLDLIETDIVEIEEILKQIEIATTSLDDEKTWKAPEKIKMDSDYIPYIKKISKNIPLALRKHLNHLREVVNIYKTTESELTNYINQDLEDLGAGE